VGITAPLTPFPERVNTDIVSTFPAVRGVIEAPDAKGVAFHVKDPTVLAIADVAGSIRRFSGFSSWLWAFFHRSSQFFVKILDGFFYDLLRAFIVSIHRIIKGIVVHDFTITNTNK
jgi:hypothetical protein